MCFGKKFHLIFMHFIHYIQCFKEIFQKPCYFFSNFVFRSIEITLKFFCELLSISINRNWFFINRKSWISFLKSQILTYSTHFSKALKLFSLSLWFGLGSTSNFCRFPPKFLQGFSLSKPVCPYYPFFFVYYRFYMHFFMHWWDIFGLCINWGFWCFKPYFVKLINGFCCYIVIFMIYVG